jgi:hypothetical protein
VIHPKLLGRGLFVFSDPGGAKPILSFIYLNKISDFLIISDREYDFFNYFNLKVNVFDKEKFEEIFESFKPDYIFTGTSYTSLIELLFIEEAKSRKIKSISFIDHYTRYPDRFILNGESIYPNEIYLTDDRAMCIAVDYKLDKYAKLKVTGNFFHQFLEQWTPKTPRALIIPGLIIPDDKKILVFAPDPMSNVGGKIKFGFDETDVWAILAKALMYNFKESIIVVIKLHPNQNIRYFKNFIAKSIYPNVIYADDTDSIELTFYADIVCGMYSSFLIESSRFNKKVLRILPNSTLEDALKGMNIGLVSSDVFEVVINVKKLLL